MSGDAEKSPSTSFSNTRLDSVSSLKAVLARHGVAASKRFGQNFLVSEAVLAEITGALVGLRGVLEIGPGPGALTQRLLECGHQVTAIELDERMQRILEETAPGAKLIRGDALKVDWRPLLHALPKPAAVCGNLPYGITGPVLGKIQQVYSLIDKAVIMVQREVMERIVAQVSSPNRSALSAWIQLYFEPKVVCTVPPGAFLPQPKVHSSVMELLPKHGNAESHLLADAHKLIRAGFRMPRKTLANNLASGLAIKRSSVESVLLDSGMATSIRPQQVSRDQWLALAAVLKPPND